MVRWLSENRVMEPKDSELLINWVIGFGIPPCSRITRYFFGYSPARIDWLFKPEVILYKIPRFRED